MASGENSSNHFYDVTGLMSGTSLDGLDIAYCRFWEDWSYEIRHAETIPYTDQWRKRLRGLDRSDALTFARTDWEFGYYMGELCYHFLEKHQIKPLLIASHGQTIFHNPRQGYTTQIGQGAALAARTGYPVVCDFRSGDVARGGQGAPLVPMGDALLFGEYDGCLNIGGFANISFKSPDSENTQDGIQSLNQRIAYDIAPANMVLNLLATFADQPYDDQGKLASGGNILPGFLSKLNALPFYQCPPPKSLGKEWVDENILPLMEEEKKSAKESGNHEATKSEKAGARDLLATYTEHLAMQIAANTNKYRVNNLLVTGGGAYNDFLIDRIRHHASADVVIPDALTIDFKEALIFAFLGLLRWRNEVNILASVTGANGNHIGGAVYL